MIQRSVYFFNVKFEMPTKHPIKLSSRQAQAREKKNFIIKNYLNPEAQMKLPGKYKRKEKRIRD